LVAFGYGAEISLVGAGDILEKGPMMKVSYSHLAGQFADPEPIFESLRELIKSGDFTLGKQVAELEEKFAGIVGRTPYAVGVGTGTDAIRLPLIALDIGSGDEVITAANTFYATGGAIATTGARPVFVDCRDDFCIDVDKIERAITPKTKAIVPVHLMGAMSNMPRILEIAKAHGLEVVEDACQGMGAELNGKRSGSFGVAGSFSLHPLKNLNVWGDGGIITTNSLELAEKLKKLRNHGLRDRDHCDFFGYNCRLDTLHAVVGLHIVETFDWIIGERRKHADFYDQEFAKIPQMRVAPRDPNMRWVHHNYVVFVDKRRDELLSFLVKQGIEAKVHYPIPLHLQKASEYLGYKKGDFPVAERHAEIMLSLPVHQHLTQDELGYVVDCVRSFFR